jgi:hypothetical protein
MPVVLETSALIAAYWLQIDPAMGFQIECIRSGEH